MSDKGSGVSKSQSNLDIFSALIFGIGVGFLIGIFLNDDYWKSKLSSNEDQWKNKLIQRGYAEHDQITGDWKWKDDK